MTKRQKSIIYTIFGALLSAPSLWFLFIKLQLHNYPQLFMHFPKGIGFVIAIALVSTSYLIIGIYLILTNKNN